MEQTARYFLKIRETDPMILAIFPLNEEVNEFNNAVYKVLGVQPITVVAEDSTNQNKK